MHINIFVTQSAFFAEILHKFSGEPLSVIPGKNKSFWKILNKTYTFVFIYYVNMIQNIPLKHSIRTFYPFPIT